jgi:hypothetical protein
LGLSISTLTVSLLLCVERSRNKQAHSETGYESEAKVFLRERGQFHLGVLTIILPRVKKKDR